MNTKELINHIDLQNLVEQAENCLWEVKGDLPKNDPRQEELYLILERLSDVYHSFTKDIQK